MAAHRLDIHRGKPLAYWCFTYIAALTVGATILALLPLEFTTYQGIGMLLGIPAILTAFIAGIAGVVATLVRCRNEWPLLIMSAAFTGLFLLFLFSENLSANQLAQFGDWIKIGQGLSLLSIVLLSGRWLFSARSGNPPREK